MDINLSKEFLSLLNQFRKSMELWIETDDISKGEFFLLINISILNQEEKLVTTANLSERMIMSKPAISQLITSLENKEYISRKIFQKDKRLTEIFFTEKGKEIFDRELQIFLDVNTKVFEKMGAKDSKKFVYLFDKFVEIYKDIMLEKVKKGGKND